MKVRVFRTAMCGGGLAYEVLVPTTECPDHVLAAAPGGRYYTRVINTNHEYLKFTDATLSMEHVAMEQGFERYDSWKKHEAACKRAMLEIARRAFPELRKVESWPDLWVTGLLAEETHASRTVQWDGVL